MAMCHPFTSKLLQGSFSTLSEAVSALAWLPWAQKSQLTPA